VGEYKESSGDANCSVCPTGTTTSYQVGGLMLSDCVCRPGFEGAVVGSACSACLTGYFKNSTATEDCTLSPLNKTTAGIASDSSSDCGCPPGSSGPLGYAGVCTLCEPGYFSDSVGALSCTQCPEGSASLIEGAVNNGTDCTCSMGYTRVNGICTACELGFYKNVTGVCI
jgi:hypothetical protein